MTAALCSLTALEKTLLRGIGPKASKVFSKKFFDPFRRNSGRWKVGDEVTSVKSKSDDVFVRWIVGRPHHFLDLDLDLQIDPFLCISSHFLVSPSLVSREHDPNDAQARDGLRVDTNLALALPRMLGPILCNTSRSSFYNLRLFLIQVYSLA